MTKLFIVLTLLSVVGCNPAPCTDRSCFEPCTHAEEGTIKCIGTQRFICEDVAPNDAGVIVYDFEPNGPSSWGCGDQTKQPL